MELMIACGIITIFFLGSGAVLSSAAKVYIQETASSGARGAIEIAGDDIRNYIMSGKSVRLLFYMDGSRTTVTLEDGTIVDVSKPDPMTPGQPLAKGTILYVDGTYRDKEGKFGEIPAITLDSTLQKKLSMVAEGIDLGYKEIYVREDGKYIQGLPYSKEFYRGMTIKLEISEAADIQNTFYVNNSFSPTDGRYKGQNLYTIKLTAKGKDDNFNVVVNTAVVSMNDLDFK